MTKLLVLALVVLAVHCRKDYTNYAFVRINDGGVEFEEKLAAKGVKADIVKLTHNSSEVVFAPADFKRFKTAFPHTSHHVLEPNMQTLFDAERAAFERSPNVTTMNTFFDAFRPIDQINTFLGSLQTQFPMLVEVVEVGRSFQNRPILGFRMGAGSPLGKPAMFFQGTVHAREWLAPTMLLWNAWNLLSNYGTDATATRLLDSMVWYCTPVVNVDGYAWSWTNERMWRKNRRVNSGSNFIGVDINRNWGPASTWCSSGSSRDPGSDTYCGTGPFSEPETAAMKNYLESLNGAVKAGIDFHTYGSLLLYPWQYTYTVLPPDQREPFIRVGNQMRDAINAVHNSRFVNQQGSQLYPHSGGFIDYNYEVNNVFGFTLEGRGNNFVLDPSNINPAGRETYAGVVILANSVLAREL